MPGKKARITLDSVKNLKRGEWLTDTVVPGFKARRPNKHVLYGASLRIGGRMRWISIGSEQDMTPDQARNEVERIRGLKRQRIDVASERDRQKSVLTLDVAVHRFLSEHVNLKLKPTTARHYRDMLHRLVLPLLGGHRLDSLTPAKLADWHINLAATPVQANRAAAVLSSLLSWAIKLRLVSSNACDGLGHYRERHVNRYPGPTELRAIFIACADLAREGRINPIFAAGIQVLILTGARRSEVFNADWRWFDIKRSALVLPDSKTGQKTIALPAAAVEVIETLPRFAGSPYIFPSGRVGRPFVNFGPNWRKLLERAGVGHWRMHDLRHGFASTAVENGAPLHVVGRQLGHARPATTNRYAHVGDDRRRDTTELVASFVAPKGGA
jgi:integrase